MNPQTLAYIKSKFTAFRTETCDIYAVTWGVDDFGAQQKSFAQVGTAVACRVITGQQSFQSGMMQQGEQKSMKHELRISLPVGTELDVDYQIDVGGVVYDVVRVIDDLTDDTQVQAVITRRR